MRIGVVGGGLMGSGIAEVCARAGVDVTVVEADDGASERSRARIEKSLGRGVRSGKVSESDRDSALERLAFSTSLEDVEGVDMAIEAIIENEVAKRELFKRLDSVLPDAEFLASNTSSVPIMKLGAGTSRPERVLGLHFFNPVPVLPLVEVVERGRVGEALGGRIALVAGELAGALTAVERLLDPRPRRLGRCVVGLHDRHVHARAGAHLRDPRSHQAATDHSDPPHGRGR